MHHDWQSSVLDSIEAMERIMRQLSLAWVRDTEGEPTAKDAPSAAHLREYMAEALITAQDDPTKLKLTTLGKYELDRLEGTRRMTDNETRYYYGLDGWEVLVGTQEEVIERALEDEVEIGGNGFDAAADQMVWPMRIIVSTPIDITDDGYAEAIGRNALEDALDNLDNEYGDPGGDITESTKAMKEAASFLGRVVLSEYMPWMCVPTGEVIEVTREEARGWWM